MRAGFILPYALADYSLVFAASKVWLQICFALIHGKTSDYSEEPS
jgi:hypothetical protein